LAGASPMMLPLARCQAFSRQLGYCFPYPKWRSLQFGRSAQLWADGRDQALRSISPISSAIRRVFFSGSTFDRLRADVVGDMGDSESLVNLKLYAAPAVSILWLDDNGSQTRDPWNEPNRSRGNGLRGLVAGDL
jgi:hypothetical protein